MRINFAQGRYKAADHMKRNDDFALEISTAVQSSLDGDDSDEEATVEEEVEVLEELPLGEME